MEEITLGQYSLPILLTVILGICFKLIGEGLADRWKSIIALVLGLGLGLLAMVYNQEAPYTWVVVIDHCLFGFMAGAAAVGLYEAQRSVMRPRE
jgi:hydrogenase/urease accessory protein HupE